MVRFHGLIASWLLLALVGCHGQEKNELLYAKASISQKNVQYQEISAKYGQIWIAYRLSGVEFINGIGEKTVVYEVADICYFDGTKYLSLGTYSNKGEILGAEGKLIKRGKFPEGFRVVGISSRVRQSPFAPSYVLQRESDKKYIETDAIAIIRIDIKNNTLILFDPFAEP